MKQRRITFIGAGNMAGAIISGLVEHDYPKELISVCAPSGERRDPLCANFGVVGSSDNVRSAKSAEVVVLAVKPQKIAKVCRSLREENVDFSKKKLLLSMAAGVPVSRFQALLGGQPNLIRIMPNTPASVGKAMSGLFAPEWVSHADRDFTAEMMGRVGKICWVANENGINHVIAAAGSAPAYFFLFMEAIQQKAQSLGFDSETARLLVQQTATGVAALVEANPKETLSALREKVTSEGGTTAAALDIFNKQQLSDIVSNAMQAAVNRAERIESDVDDKPDR